MRFLIAALLVLAIMLPGCKSSRKKMKTAQNQELAIWVNPQILPAYHPAAEGIFMQYPEISDAGMDTAGLEGFCNRMNELFRESGIGYTDALVIYLLLHESGLLANESIGMPDPEEPLVRESMDSFQSRVALKRIDENSYEIFYRRTGCGYTYVYGTFVLPSDTHSLSIAPIETWRISVPC